MTYAELENEVTRLRAVLDRRDAQLLAFVTDNQRLRHSLKNLLNFCDELCEDIKVSKHYPSADAARKLLEVGGN